MNFRIRYNREKIKELISALQKAYELGDIHVVKRVSAMLRLHEGQSISNIAQTLGVSLEAVYNWLKDYLLKGSDSFKFDYSPGRKPKMTKVQKLELKQCLLLPPTEFGYDTGCWNTLIITDLIYRKWGVLYHRGYLCQLLHNLGFSWQKARFVSDHLNPIKNRTVYLLTPLIGVTQGKLRHYAIRNNSIWTKTNDLSVKTRQYWFYMAK